MYRRTHVVDRCKVFRLEVLAELVDHVDEHVGCRSWNAGARGHRTLALHRVVGAEDEGHAIKQIDGRLGVGAGRIVLLCHVCLDGSSLDDSECIRQAGVRKWLKLEKKHAVAIAEETVFLLHGMRVGGEYSLSAKFFAGKGAYQHQKGGLRKVEVGEKAANYLKLMPRAEEDAGLAGMRRSEVCLERSGRNARGCG